jgi:Methyltransferase domain
VPTRDQARTLFALGRDTTGNLLAFRRATDKHSPHPPQTGLVLDVGSGQSAHRRADLVVDKYVTDDFERGSALDLSKPLVVADGQALPFADGAFAYVVASHVLEHATDPLLFATELSRVGDAGFVQVPSRLAELTFGWAFHPWLIDRVDDTLIFNPRNGRHAPAGEFFHHAFADSPQFQVWFGAHRDAWHHSIHWSHTLSVKREGSSVADQTAALDVERALAVLPGMGARGPQGAVRDILYCPHDRGSLSSGASSFTCEECDRSYPVAGGVPVLLREAAR